MDSRDKRNNICNTIKTITESKTFSKKRIFSGYLPAHLRIQLQAQIPQTLTATNFALKSKV